MSSEGFESPPGVSLFKNASKGATPKKEHKVLLSYESEDAIMRVPVDWEYARFLKEVANVFPNLKKNFKLIDADFLELNKHSFHLMKRSHTPETWLLVRANEDGEESLLEPAVVLERPRQELMKYDVHPNALTQSGSYHFSSCYQAFCEFIDNAIQATNENEAHIETREIVLHLYLKQKVACIFDNGQGMTSEGLKAFASYFLTQTDRGLEPGTSKTFGFLDGNISKFGVGATQAGFYLGNTMKVITKTRDSPFVREITISKEKLHERAKHNMPVFEDYKYIRNVSDTSTMEKDEDCIKKLIQQEHLHENFTMIVLKELRQEHVNYMKEDSCEDLAKNLAHVYHFYLHGIQGSAKKLNFDRIGSNGFEESKNSPVSIILSVNDKKKIKLKDCSDDILSRYQENARSVFSFCVDLKLPEKEDIQKVQGCLMYFPNESGEETLPTVEVDTPDGNNPEPMFECFWQGRLAPLSYVNRMPFCAKPEQRSRKQKDLLPDICFNRIRGLLFFNRYTPVSNNKLKILLDTRMDLSDALSDASSLTARRLPNDFRQWLELCHREYDKELIYSDPLPSSQQPSNGDTFYASLSIVHSYGKEEYQSLDVVKIETRPVAYGKINYFVKKGKHNEVGTVNYCKLPEEVYGEHREEKSVMRIAGKPDQAQLNKVFSSEKLLLPKSMKVYEEQNKSREVPAELEFLAGEEMKTKTNFWVAVFNGEKPPKMITEIHQQKVAVKVEITGRVPLVNSTVNDKQFAFKPFFLDRAGVYDMRFSVLLGNKPCPGVDRDIKIHVKPNVAEIVNLSEEVPSDVQLGEPSISFNIFFHDIFQNLTNLFKGNISHVILTCECKDAQNYDNKLKIKGMKNKYKPDSNGEVKVTGVSVEPVDRKSPLAREYEFWVIAEDVGDVMFPLRICTGPPENVHTTQLETLEFENFDSFPEFEVKLVDKWNQTTSLKDKSTKVALICDAFPQKFLLSTVSHGKAKFPSCPLKIDSIGNKVKKKVNIAIVKPEVHKKKGNKETIKEILKDLHHFHIAITPSRICQKIQILQKDSESNVDNNVLELDAVAGTVIKDLKITGYSQTGDKLTDEEFLAQNPHVTTTWAEVNKKTLPNLPDCPVTKITQVNVQNVQCFFNFNGFELRNEAKLRINVTAGPAKKWSFQPLSLEVHCDRQKDLEKAVKIVVLDKHHNVTSPLEGILPVISVEHAHIGKRVEYTGSVFQRENEFFFSSGSVLNGHSGRVTLYVKDEKNKLNNDAISIELANGTPSKLNVACKLFETSNGKENVIKLFSRASITQHILCSITDTFGNQTPVKTPIAIEWVPSSAGNSFEKRTNQKGEIIFQANSIKCYADKGTVTMKICPADMKNIEPVLVNVEILRCNRITKVTTHMEQSDLTADSKFPVIKVTHETEDGVQAPDFKSHLSFSLQKPSGEMVNVSSVYPTRNRKMIEDILILEPAEEFQLEESGIWIIQCIYTEKRHQIKNLTSSPTVRSNECRISVMPGPATHLGISLPAETVLFVKNTPEGRTLLPPPSQRLGPSPPVFIYGVDEYDNKTNIQGTVSVSIETENGERNAKSMPELDRQCLSFRMRGSEHRVPTIFLRDKRGCKMGYYFLRFAFDGLKSYKIKLAFSTNEETEKLSQELAPLQNELAQLQRKVREKQMEFENKKREVRQALKGLPQFFNNLNHIPRITDIDNHIHILHNKSYELETRQQHLRPCRKEPRNFPPQNVRQYIKGLVCELAYVSDIDICRILSWYAQGKMKVALCEKKEQQRTVYDLGYAAYAEDLIMGFQKRGYFHNPKDLLPIDLPKPPDGFKSKINFAVNLLEFVEENQYLRATLFWSVFGKTIVVQDLSSAQAYRAHLLRLRQPCPAILTLNGDLIAADGLMDPKRRCPERLEILNFTFGELPVTQKPQYSNLKFELESLNSLRRIVSDCETFEQEVRQYQLNYQDKQTTNTPIIRDLENKRNRLRRMEEDYSCAPSPSKRSRR